MSDGLTPAQESQVRAIVAEAIAADRARQSAYAARCIQVGFRLQGEIAAPPADQVAGDADA